MVVLHIAFAMGLAAVAFQHTVARCPDFCNCDGGTVRCIAQNLKSLPEGLPPDTTDLNLSDNDLDSLDLDRLKPLSQLQGLDVSSNNIKTIRGSFEHFQNLVNVQLYNNKLTTLSPNMFGKAVTRMKYVSLSNNPWDCDCNLKWMITDMQNGSSPLSTGGVTCETPKEFRGNYIADVDVSKLVCKQGPTLSQQDITMIIGIVTALLVAVMAVAIFCPRRSTPVANPPPESDVIEEGEEAHEDQSGQHSPTPARFQTTNAAGIARASDTYGSTSVSVIPKALRSGQREWLQQDEVDSQDVYRSSSI